MGLGELLDTIDGHDPIEPWRCTDTELEHLVANLSVAIQRLQSFRITLLTEAGAEASASGLPVKLQIAADKWVISLRPESCRDVLKIDVGQIIKVVAMSEDLEEQK